MTKASTVKINNSEQFNNVMMNYFYKKNSAELYAVLDYIDKNDMYDSKSAKSPIYGFFAGIRTDNPQVFKHLQQTNNSPTIAKMFKASEQFSYVAEDMLKRKDYYLESPSSLDAFWGYFFATGDDRVIKKICDTSVFSQDVIVKDAAKWSLASNQSVHPNKIKACSMYK